ncbi:hypothetical protein POM88_006285 [Heracleum sosnowskyi]|uniref:Uncharacterized protein n=1 Tax=Heracleum sosnowskyi TaxID=360622 RepID=A0AAD8N562_9APIA|nr:hypothetical protein POM88_006285 [Heracleum sosnowskyi]
MAAEILSRLSFNKCSDPIQEAVAVLVEAICNDVDQVAVAAASTSARLAFASSKWINVSHLQAVQNALTKHRTREAETCLTMFLVFVCRGNDLSILFAVAGSALGVVANIVSWGSPLQIQCLVEDCKLMQCLEQKILCSSFKKFQMEGGRIISNIAARSEILIKDMDEAVLTHLLSKLLEADESDVKMEAAWAVFNMHYNVE